MKGYANVVGKLIGVKLYRRQADRSRFATAHVQCAESGEIFAYRPEMGEELKRFFAYVRAGRNPVEYRRRMEAKLAKGLISQEDMESDPGMVHTHGSRGYGRMVLVFHEARVVVPKGSEGSLYRVIVGASYGIGTRCEISVCGIDHALRGRKHVVRKLEDALALGAKDEKPAVVSATDGALARDIFAAMASR